MIKLNADMKAGTDAATVTDVQVNHVSQTIAKPHVGSSFSFGDFLKVIIEKDPFVKYSIQYADYEDNQWTCESVLMPHRAESISNDMSIRKVFIKFSNGTCLVVCP